MNQKSNKKNNIVCVTSSGPDLDSQLDPKFGRCQYFIIVDLDNLSFKAEINTGRGGSGGVGVGAVQFVANEGVGTVVTGKVGPKAQNAFNAANIQVVTGANGTVRDIIAKQFNKKI